MIVTLKRFRPWAWPKVAWRGVTARRPSATPTREPRPEGAMEQFDRLASHYAATILRAADR